MLIKLSFCILFKSGKNYIYNFTLKDNLFNYITNNFVLCFTLQLAKMLYPNNIWRWQNKLWLKAGYFNLQMLTLSADRFQRIQKEAPQEFQNYLVQVTKYQAAQHCKVLKCLILSYILKTTYYIYLFFIYFTAQNVRNAITSFPNSNIPHGPIL